MVTTNPSRFCRSSSLAFCTTQSQSTSAYARASHGKPSVTLLSRFASLSAVSRTSAGLRRAFRPQVSESWITQGRELQAQFFASHGRFEDLRAQRKGLSEGHESRGPSQARLDRGRNGSGKAAPGGEATKALEQVCGAAAWPRRI